MTPALLAGCEVLTAVGSIVAILLGVAAILGWFVWWRAHRTADVRRALVDVRAFFHGATASGGARTNEFLQPERQATEREFGDLVNAIPAVCAARPGLLSALDLPLVPGHGVMRQRGLS